MTIESYKQNKQTKKELNREWFIVNGKNVISLINQQKKIKIHRFVCVFVSGYLLFIFKASSSSFKSNKNKTVVELYQKNIKLFLILIYEFRHWLFHFLILLESDSSFPPPKIPKRIQKENQSENQSEFGNFQKN